MAQNTIEVLKVLLPKKALLNGKSSEYIKMGGGGGGGGNHIKVY